VSPVRYELGSRISEDSVLHSHRRGNLKSYTSLASSKTLLFFYVLKPRSSVAIAIFFAQIFTEADSNY
jgi:hypothetical protein